jgi:hypothetical protein
MKRRAFYVALVVLLGLLATSSAWAQPPQTYVVNSKENYHDANPGNGVCAATGGQCTLVAAIEEAYADGVESIIHFSRSFSSTDSIDGCSLPGLGANTTIDASNQWDTTYDRPGVEIVGGACSLCSAARTIQGSRSTGGTPTPSAARRLTSVTYLFQERAS